MTSALVPTMGYLHEGHRSLLRIAKKKADKVVLTIFVNPTQFGPNEDFKKYPRNTAKDLALAKEAGVDLVFLPTSHTMYPEGYETFVEVTQAIQGLCGRSRPSHFRGVATIVLKFFNLVQPDYAIFGKKDYQQFGVIKKMVADLNLPIQIIGAPTVREPSGLAMSSRNVYLDDAERKAALSLSEGLFHVRHEINRGQKNISKLLREFKKGLAKNFLIRLDYVACVDAESIQPLRDYKRGRTLFAVAAFVGKTRLIDNVVL